VTRGYCQECRISENKRKKQLRDSRIANGLCLFCPELAAPDNLYCLDCRQIHNERTKKIDKKRYDNAKSEGKCISCSNIAKPGKVRCEACTKRTASGGSVVGWINKFHLYLKMGGKCAMCGNLNLRVLVIDHVQYYNHHIANNGKIWNTLMLRMRQSSIKRAEILQGYKEGKYQLLCPNCNRLKELKRTGCFPYIRLAGMGEYYSSDQRSYSWFNKFTFLNQIGGRCFKCGINDLAVLEIHHIQLFHHSKNEKEWESIRVKLRRNKTYRCMILQGVKEGKYSILCCNCNKLEAQKQVRSEPYIQQALIQLDRLNSVRDTSENNQNVLQIIQLNIVICILYLFVLFCFYHCAKDSI
jgi:hypothetical protein